MKLMHFRPAFLAFIAVTLTGAVTVSAQTFTLEHELTVSTVGWYEVGTCKENWIPVTPPGESYLAYDNIQGSSQVGTYSKALPKRFEGKHDWAVTVNSFMFKQTGAAISYNHFYFGVIETNGWTSSDFAGVRFLDSGSASVKRGYAFLRDGASSWASSTYVNLSTAVDYRIDIGYTNNVVATKFTRLSDSVVVGTLTATATGTPSFSWGNIGFGNGLGVAYAANGFSINRVRDISFTGDIPPPGTLFVIR